MQVQVRVRVAARWLALALTLVHSVVWSSGRVLRKRYTTAPVVQARCCAVPGPMPRMLTRHFSLRRPPGAASQTVPRPPSASCTPTASPPGLQQVRVPFAFVCMSTLPADKCCWLCRRDAHGAAAGAAEPAGAGNAPPPGAAVAHPAGTGAATVNGCWTARGAAARAAEPGGQHNGSGPAWRAAALVVAHAASGACTNKPFV